MSTQTNLYRFTIYFDLLHYYPPVVIVNKGGGSFNTSDDLFGRICVHNKLDNANLKIFNMTKGINESKALSKHILYECIHEFDGRKCNSYMFF